MPTKLGDAFDEQAMRVADEKLEGKWDFSFSLPLSSFLCSLNPPHPPTPAFKAAFLQYRRMQLKCEMVATGDDKRVHQAEAELVRLEQERKDALLELEVHQKTMSEKALAYGAKTKQLIATFEVLVKQVNALTKGPLAGVFRGLQAHYVTLVARPGGGGGGGGANESSSNSDDDDDNNDAAAATAVHPLPAAPVAAKQGLVLGRSSSGGIPAAVNPRSRMMRSESTIGWTRAAPAPPAAFPGIALASGPQDVQMHTRVTRFCNVVSCMESALYLNHPMTAVMEAMKEKQQRLQAEIEEIRAQTDAMRQRVSEEEKLSQLVASSEERAALIQSTLEAVTTGGGESLVSWIEGAANVAASVRFLEMMNTVMDNKLRVSQPYLAVLTGERQVARTSAEQVAEDGSLFGCEQEALFEMLISGEGAARFDGFDLAFMYGFRAFMTPSTLLERFVEVFCTTPETKTQEERQHIARGRCRVLALIQMWVGMHEYDAQEKRISLLLHSFLETASIAGFSVESKRIATRLQGNTFFDDLVDTPFPESIRPRAVAAGDEQLSFLDLDPLEVARQITLADAAAYQGMQTRELLDCKWSKEGGRQHAPTVTLITDRFNRMAAWVVGVILREPDLLKRSQILANMIRVAERLLELRNYNGVMQIIASLSKTEVMRLKKTWAALPKASRAAYESLHQLLDKNCARLRELYREAPMPCIPYIGTFMTDLTFIGEMKLRLPNGMICFRKLLLQAQSLESLLGKRGQDRDLVLFRLKEVKEIRDFIARRDLPFDSENDAYAHSLILEPRT